MIGIDIWIHRDILLTVVMIQKYHRSSIIVGYVIIIRISNAIMKNI